MDKIIEVLKSITKSLDDIVIITDYNDNILFSSKSVSYRLGYDHEKLVGKSFHDSFRFMGKSLKLEVQTKILGNIAHKTEPKLMMIEFTISALMFPNGFSYKLLIGRDITSKEVLNLQMNRKLRKAEGLNLLRENLLTMIAHEIKNPLSTIKSSLDIINRIKDSNINKDLLDQHLKKILKQAQSVIEIIHQVDIIKRQTAFKPEDGVKKPFKALVEKLTELYKDEIDFHIDKL